MSLSKKRAQRRATLIGVLVGFIIIFTFVISLIAPDLGSRTSDSGDFPTVTPFGTLPPPTPVIIPTPDPNPQLEGAPVYIHSTGLFQTFRPAGDDWVSSEAQRTETSIASVVIQSRARLAVIHNYIRAGVQYDNLDSLSENFLNESHFADAWTEYDSWQEAGRTITGDKVIVSFDLLSDGNQYLGRSIAWADAGWLYISRLVVPANNPALLDRLQELVIPVFIGYSELQDLPQFWPAYIDQELGFMIKHPESWEVVAGGVGRPVTFNVAVEDGKTTVRTWTVLDRSVGTAEEAEAWLTETEPTAAVLKTEPVEHAMGAGYQIAYTYRDTAGDPHSGLAVLLSDADNTLFAANLQSDSPEVNWLDAESLSEADGETRQALVNGFVVLPAEARQPVAVEIIPETAEPSPTPAD